MYRKWIWPTHIKSILEKYSMIINGVILLTIEYCHEVLITDSADVLLIKIILAPIYK